MSVTSSFEFPTQSTFEFPVQSEHSNSNRHKGADVDYLTLDVPFSRTDVFKSFLFGSVVCEAIYLFIRESNTLSTKS